MIVDLLTILSVVIIVYTFYAAIFNRFNFKLYLILLGGFVGVLLLGLGVYFL